MKETATTVFVCVTCRPKDGDPNQRPGQLLFDAISARLHDGGAPAVTVTPVECLSVCKRPCTVALSAAGKWTYVIGDLNQRDHVEDIIAAAALYDASADGIVPWRERPVSIRRGVVARIPPLSA